MDALDKDYANAAMNNTSICIMLPMAARPLDGCGNMCNGDGVVEKGSDDERRCPTCGGSGLARDDDDGHEEVIKTSIK